MPEPDSRFSKNILQFKVGSSIFVISTSPGFQLMRWTIATLQEKRDVLFWPDEPQTFDGTVMGGNPVLFPFSGRSYDRGMEGFWRSPEGERLEIPIHGFARSCPFKTVEKTERSIAAELQPDATANRSYPYDYRFIVQYRFEELSLGIRFSLTNRGERPIPWSAGHHFFFNLPWHANAGRKDYRIIMDARKCGYHGPDGKVVAEKSREKFHDLSNPELLDRIHFELRSNRISVGPKGDEEDMHILIGKEPVPGKNLAVVSWSPSVDAPFFCIEPWMGLPNAAEHGKGLHWVEPGQTQDFEVEIQLF